ALLQGGGHRCCLCGDVGARGDVRRHASLFGTDAGSRPLAVRVPGSRWESDGADVRAGKGVIAMRLLARLVINAFALWCAARFIDGIQYAGSWQGLLGLALVFGFVNTLIRPVLSLLSFPIQLLTLG